MTGDYTAQAFGYIADGNPLRELSDRDRRYLWALLRVYDEATRVSSHESPLLPLEQAAKATASAAKLASTLQSDVFDGSASEALSPVLAEFRDLPATLTRFSIHVGNALDSLGKTGHRTSTMATRYLVQASEFVHLMAGQFYDEHLAELFQAISKSDQSEDLSGDAIRKKREYLKKHHPDAYLSVIDDLREAVAAEASGSKTPTQVAGPRSRGCTETPA